MLANIIDGRYYIERDDPKTTLIVATPALVEQWYEEIHSKVDLPIRVLRHIGGKKLSSNDNIATMQSFDIVLVLHRSIVRDTHQAGNLEKGFLGRVCGPKVPGQWQSLLPWVQLADIVTTGLRRTTKS